MYTIFHILLGFFHLAVSVVLAVVALYAGFFTLSHITKGIDIRKELLGRNIAVGLFVASVYIGISIPMQSGIAGVNLGLNKIFIDGLLTFSDTFDIFASVLEMILGVLIAIGSIYLTVYFFSRLNRNLNAMDELKKGNVAVASLIAGMILAVSFVIQFGVIGVLTAFV